MTCIVCDSDLPPRKRRLCSDECAAEAKRRQARATYLADPSAARARVAASRSQRDPLATRASREAWLARQPTEPCAACGIDTGKHRMPDRRRTCSTTCRSFLRTGRWPQSRVPQPSVVDAAAWQRSPAWLTYKEQVKSPLRRALEAQDEQAINEALQESIDIAGECWLWRRMIDSKGYARIKHDGHTRGVHRLIAEALHGPLGKQAVHHRCATPRCVRPSHLQPVSQRENIAEMLHRNYYVARIAELEAALMDADPQHPALRGVPVAVA